MSHSITPHNASGFPTEYVDLVANQSVAKACITCLESNLDGNTWCIKSEKCFSDSNCGLTDCGTNGCIGGTSGINQCGYVTPTLTPEPPTSDDNFSKHVKTLCIMLGIVCGCCLIPLLVLCFKRLASCLRRNCLCCPCVGKPPEQHIHYHHNHQSHHYGTVITEGALPTASVDPEYYQHQHQQQNQHPTAHSDRLEQEDSQQQHYREQNTSRVDYHQYLRDQQRQKDNMVFYRQQPREQTDHQQNDPDSNSLLSQMHTSSSDNDGGSGLLGRGRPAGFSEDLGTTETYSQVPIAAAQSSTMNIASRSRQSIPIAATQSSTMNIASSSRQSRYTNTKDFEEVDVVSQNQQQQQRKTWDPSPNPAGITVHYGFPEKPHHIRNDDATGTEMQ